MLQKKVKSFSKFSRTLARKLVWATDGFTCMINSGGLNALRRRISNSLIQILSPLCCYIVLEQKRGKEETLNLRLPRHVLDTKGNAARKPPKLAVPASVKVLCRSENRPFVAFGSRHQGAMLFIPIFR